MNQKNEVVGEILGLDIGSARIGVARISSFARIAEALDPIIVSAVEDPIASIVSIIQENEAVAIVVGLPRSLDGQETSQTSVVREFVAQLRLKTSEDLYFIDEAGTTKEAELRVAGKTSISVDSMAAAIMLEDFINQKSVEQLRVS